MKIHRSILTSIALFLCYDFLSAAFYSDFPEVKQFASEISKANNLSYEKILAHFASVQSDEKGTEDLLDLSARPVERTASWDRYRKIFLTKERIAQGKSFYKKNLSDLKKAYKKYGVPASIVVATIGMESVYGKNIGRFNVFQSLCIHAFEGKRRKKFFKEQLKYLIILHEKEGLFDLKNLKGSYSGAIGPAQFMPSSIFHYAVDGNQDNARDMLDDYRDIIMSVANYYKQAGLKKNSKVVKKISFKQAQKIKKKEKNRVVVLTLENDKKEYYYSYKNFRAIKRYNNSNYYAMALYLLGKKILSK